MSPRRKPLDGTEGGDSPFFSLTACGSGSSPGQAAEDCRRGAALSRWRTRRPNAAAPGAATATSVRRPTAAASGRCRRAAVNRSHEEGFRHRRDQPPLAADHRRHEHAALRMWTGPGDDEHSVAVQTVGAAEHRVLVKGGDAPRYAATPGMLLYSHVGDLFAVPWRPPQPDLGRAVPAALSRLPQRWRRQRGVRNYVVSRTARWPTSPVGGNAMPRGSSGSTAAARSIRRRCPSATTRTS